MLYSDGITEARNSAGELFGVDRLAECVESNSALEPELGGSHSQGRRSPFPESDALTDDLTCVAIKVVRRRASPWRVRSSRSAAISKNFAGRANSCATFAAIFPVRRSTKTASRQLELAVNEACSNIMKHAYHGRADQWIHLEAEAFPDRSSIRLHHLGDPFDPSTVAAAAARWLARLRIRRLPHHPERR